MCCSEKRNKKYRPKPGRCDPRKQIFDPSDPKVTQNGKLRHFKQCQKVRKIPVFVVNTGYFYGCGGRTRTYDLRVMSPTSFQLLYSAI